MSLQRVFQLSQVLVNELFLDLWQLAKVVKELLPKFISFTFHFLFNISHVLPLFKCFMCDSITRLKQVTQGSFNPITESNPFHEILVQVGTDIKALMDVSVEVVSVHFNFTFERETKGESSQICSLCPI